MEDTAISIVIPAYNEEKTLPGLLMSINSQGVPCEVIVADAESTDSTAMIAKAHGCKVVPARKGNPSIARNAGAHAARGDLIIFLDADVILPEGFLRKNIREFMRKKLDVAAVYSRANSSRIDDQIMIDVAVNTWYFLTQKFWPHAMGCCIFSKKDTFFALGGFDESVQFNEDCDYVNRAFRSGGRYGVLASMALPISMRRFEKHGRMKTMFMYLALNARRAFSGELRSGVDYEYGF